MVEPGYRGAGHRSHPPDRPDETGGVYRLISTDTIEEKVLQLQQSKRDLFSRVIEDGGLLGTALTVDDLRGLLS